MNVHALWPIAPESILPFLIAVSLVELAPGPNMGYLAALAVGEGRAAGLRAVAGVTLGLAVYMVLAVIGVAELIAAAPLLYGALRWSGVVYLFYLAWEAWRGDAETSPGQARRVDRAPFRRGLIANLLNPKVAVFYVSLLPGFIAPDHGPFWSQALTLGTLHIAVSVLVHVAIVMGGARIGVYAKGLGGPLRVRRIMAAAIAGIAFWLSWQTATG